MNFGYRKPKERRVRVVTRWTVNTLAVIALALFLVEYLADDYIVTGQSMEQTLKAGDRVLIDRLSYGFRNPDRFDVVLFQKNDGEQRYAKRVIGLPGETVQIRNGDIYIDDNKLELPVAEYQVGVAGMARTPITLGEDEFFLLGDNPSSSEDSRFQQIGNVTRKQIIGKVWCVCQPFERAGFVAWRQNS